MTQEKLDCVPKEINSRKAAGFDKIPSEVWKTREFSNIQLRHCNDVYNQNTIDGWTKGLILSFVKKGNLRITKNYRGITLTSIAAKIYINILCNCIKPKIEKILRKNHNGFPRNLSPTSQILTICRILGVPAKNLEATILFIDFSIHRGKMEQILLAHGFPKETVAAIIILYKNTKVKVRSPDGHTDYFDIVADVLQGDTLAPYLFIICLDYVLRTSIDLMKENSFNLAKERSRRYPAQTITDANYSDDIALLVNIPPKLNPCYIVWNKQQLTYLSTQARQNTSALIKEATSPF